MNILRTIFVFSVFIFFCACNGAETTADTKSGIIETTVADTMVAVPKELFMETFNSATSADLLFYNKDFSSSLTDKPAIEQMMRGISTAGARPSVDCPAEGRIFFIGDGKTLLEADFHFKLGKCAYFVFYQNGKKAYGNQMNDDGIKMFQSYLTTVKAVPEEKK